MPQWRTPRSPKNLESALKAEEDALASVQATAEDRAKLGSLQRQSAQLKVRRGVYERALADLRDLKADIVRFASRGVLDDTWPERQPETRISSSRCAGSRSDVPRPDISSSRQRRPGSRRDRASA